MDVIQTLPIEAWHGPFDPALRDTAADALEAGRVLVLPRLPFRMAPEEAFLASPSAMGSERKNISFDPATGNVGNSSLTGADADRLRDMLRRFGDSAEALLRDLLPGYAAGLERARTSFRPAEIAGRDYSPRHDDRLLHVDAFPSRPMRGRRILRLFSNIAPDGAARHWRVGEPFADFAGRFLPRAGTALPGSAWLMQQLGLTKGRRSEYDRLMLSLHDTGKLDAAYQDTAPRADLAFAAGTTWLCFTDQVLHAALSGHCALEQTFHLPVEAMVHPERSPLRVLQSLTGRALA
ncbi:MAG: Kdo hydroxylase family protein [Acetobacteraceae bacterium]